MSQKAEALQVYNQLKGDYNSWTNWHVPTTKRFDLVRGEVTEETCQDAYIELTYKLNDMSFEWVKFPQFVRACPLNPRAGVLESVAVHNEQEYKDAVLDIAGCMLGEDQSAVKEYEHGFTDPNGCIIVMPYIDAFASAVVAPNNYIYMGRDNNGITAGKDGLKFAIPLAQGRDENINHDFKHMNLTPENIQLEFVASSDNLDPRRSSLLTPSSYLVQLRGCEGVVPITPAPAGVTISGTFHGADRITVKHIHLVEDSSEEQLDKMEEALRNGMPEGSVVCHNNGTHLSHHSAQCLKYNVPYIASLDVEVGQQWTQASAGWVVLDNDGTYEPQPYDPYDFKEYFDAGLQIGYRRFARQHGWLSNPFHQFVGGALAEPQTIALLGGAFVGWIIQATYAVSLGEVRHAKSRTTGGNFIPYAVARYAYSTEWDEIPTRDMNDRKSYYLNIEGKPLDTTSMRNMMQMLDQVFNLDWSSGYGGKAYSKTTCMGIEAIDALESYWEDGNRDNLMSLIDKANALEHAVHNNGFFFNKFMSPDAINWGTDPNKVRVQPENFFKMYAVAMDVYQHHQGDEPLPALQNIQPIFDAVQKYTKTGEVTPLLAMYRDVLHYSFRHPPMKSGQKHIPCGVTDCPSCAYENKQQAEAPPSAISVPHTQDTSLMLPKAEVTDVFKFKTLFADVYYPSDIAFLSQWTYSNNEWLTPSNQTFLAQAVTGFDSKQLKEYSTWKEWVLEWFANAVFNHDENWSFSYTFKQWEMEVALTKADEEKDAQKDDPDMDTVNLCLEVLANAKSKTTKNYVQLLMEKLLGGTNLTDAELAFLQKEE